MPDVVAGNIDVVRICQEDDHWIGETGWTAPRVWLGTGSWQDRTTQAVEAVMAQFRKAAREGESAQQCGTDTEERFKNT